MATLAMFVLGACGASGGTGANPPGAGASGAQPTTGGAQQTAAGGGPTKAPGGGGGTADPCPLLSLADLKTATGTDFPAGVPDGKGGCDWSATTDAYHAVSLTLTTSSFAANKAGFPGGTDTTVSGHPAYWGVKGNLSQEIFVDLGTKVLFITVGPSPADAQGVTKHLAELAVARM